MEWRCVYLTFDGKAPSTESLGEEKRNSYLSGNEKRLHFLSHTTDMLDLFNDFESVCKADSVRAFIKSVIKNYEYGFKTNMSTQEENMIKEELRKNVNLFEIADQIALAKDNLKKEVRDRIFESCLKSFVGDYLSEKYHFEWLQKTSIQFQEEFLLFYLPGRKDCAFHVTMEFGSGWRFYCGIEGEALVRSELSGRYEKEWKMIQDEMRRHYSLWTSGIEPWSMVISLDEGFGKDDYYIPFLKGKKVLKNIGKNLAVK